MLREVYLIVNAMLLLEMMPAADFKKCSQQDF